MERQALSVTELNNRIKGLLDLDPMLADVCVRGELSNYKIYPSGHHYFTLKDSESSLRCVMFKSSASRLRFRPESGMGVTAWGRVAVFMRDGAYQLYCTQLMPEGTGDLQVAFEQLKARLEEEGLPVRVQGAEAPPEIAGAIRYANEFDVADLIITGRGGGSIEDLWAFNDERVARAIYASRIPVISAVGHEPDVTISDYVADRRASTPSNAAEIAVPDCREVAELLNGYEIRSSQAMRKKLAFLGERLENLKNKRVLSEPTAQIDLRRMELDHMRKLLAAAEERELASCRERFVRLTAALDAMSPLRVLTRGYAIAADGEGRCVRSVEAIRPGDRLRLTLADGRADCLVENTQRSKINGSEKESAEL